MVLGGGAPGLCVPPLCGVAGGLEEGVKGVEVIRQAVCGADCVGGGPIVSSGIEAAQLLSVLSYGCCDGFLQSRLHCFVLHLID